jgi:tetratricopeptide (TPR) repeat protein
MSHERRLPHARQFSLRAARFAKVGTGMSKKRLDSWKAIAAFLGRSLRTVQRWHACNGLPVHRFGGQKGSVFAYEEEIELWLANLAAEPGAAQQQANVMLDAGKRSSQALTATANCMWETRSERNIQAIAELYRRAIAEDSTNTAAYAGLANALVFCAMVGMMDEAIAYPCAAEALRCAPQSDRDDLDAKCPAAWVDMLYHRNWPRARMGFEELRNKRPSSFALAGLAAMEIADGNLASAQDRAWEAWRLNPLVGALGAFLCWVVYLNGEFQQALDLIAQIRSGGGDGTLISTVEALVMLQCPSAAANLNRIQKAAASFPMSHTLQGILGYAYGASGQKNEAWESYEHLAHGAEMDRKSNGYGLAIASMGLGNQREAVGWLETAFAEGTLWSLGFRSDPLLRPFHQDPQFLQLADKIGTPARISVEQSIASLKSAPLFDGNVAVQRP